MRFLARKTQREKDEETEQEIVEEILGQHEDEYPKRNYEAILIEAAGVHEGGEYQSGKQGHTEDPP